MAESLPELSVIVASRDRADSLARCLAALDESWAATQVAWEVIVVDNGSMDATPDVAQDFARRAAYPVMLLQESRPGVSPARNLGAAAARSDWLAFTDDDCLVDPQWPAALLAVIAHQPSLGVIGGRVDLADSLDLPASIRPFSDAMDITDIDVLTARMIGCNFAIRSDEFRAIGGFDPRLGCGTPALSSEDFDLFYRALRHMVAIRYEPSVRLRHAHGRRGEAQARELAKAYTHGRGAFLAKHILRGDGLMLRRFRWELSMSGDGRMRLLQGFFGRLLGR
ncbi:MAG: glycosyltransferase family 2 protein [Gammaproteobacteria bacterium]